jgi:hypothetical protein
MTIAFNLSQLANYVNTSGKLDAANGLVNAIPVANGGTGTNTLTANNVLLGNGTSAIQVVAPGTSGNILKSNGTTWQSVAVPFGFTNLTAFTSSGTWTVPAGVTKCKVTVIGGGGAVDNYFAGGSGGGTAIKIVSGLTPGGTVAITIGAGGTYIGNSGGTSSFGSYCSASGGQGGQTTAGFPSIPGIGSNGDLNFRGYGGGSFDLVNTFGQYFGGGSFFGSNYGAGGPNYIGSSLSNDGSSGIIVIEY